MAAGAYRGYGATQGIFALETSVNELAEKLGIDPTVLREKNMLREGMKMPGLLRGNGKCLCPGPVYGKVQGAVWMGRKISGAGNGKRKGADCRCCNGNAGFVYFECRCRLCDGKAGR